MDDILSKSEPATEEKGMPVVAFGNVELNILLRQVTVEGLAVALSPKEFSLLYVLIEHAGEPVDQQTLSEAAGACPGGRSVDSLVYRLRKKLNGSGSEIITRRGQGYLFILKKDKRDTEEKI